MSRKSTNMKREGRQGMQVRREANKQTAEATVGKKELTRAARGPLKQPNDDSPKHTGKCRKKARCNCAHCHRLHPVSKSRDKAKGSYKLKSSDVLLNHRLLTWHVAGAAAAASSSMNANLNWSEYSGASATAILDSLATDSCWSSEGGEDDFQIDPEDYDSKGNFIAEENEEEEDHNCVNKEEEEEEEEEEDDDDDDMGFCEVGLVWDDIDDEEGWCVVNEM